MARSKQTYLQKPLVWVGIVALVILVGLLLKGNYVKTAAYPGKLTGYTMSPSPTTTMVASYAPAKFVCACKCGSTTGTYCAVPYQGKNILSCPDLFFEFGDIASQDKCNLKDIEKKQGNLNCVGYDKQAQSRGTLKDCEWTATTTSSRI